MTTITDEQTVHCGDVPGFAGAPRVTADEPRDIRESQAFLLLARARARLDQLEGALARRAAVR